ncbi:MAG: PAS domain-containing protein [Planctomycetaceae bacterium]|nr:PAS domain-containing protein [Planctomycetaceae bacterium]
MSQSSKTTVQEQGRRFARVPRASRRRRVFGRLSPRPRSEFKLPLPRERSALWRYGVALLIAAGAFGLRLLLDPVMGAHAPYVTYMVAVAATVWLAGFWPAMLTAALGIPGAMYLLQDNPFPWPARVIGIAIYALGMLSLAFMGHSMRKARRQAQQAAAQSQHEQEETARARLEWEQTFESVPDLVAIIDAEHQIVRANKAMRERLKIDAAAWPGLGCYRAGGGLEGPVRKCPHAEAIAEGKEHIAEVYEERLGGHFLISCTPMRDGQGRIIGTVHVARDITALKKTQEALEASEQRLQAQATELTRSNRDLEEFAHIASHDLKEPLGVITMYLALLKKKYAAVLDDQARQFVGHAVDAVGRMGHLINDLLTYSRVGRKTEGMTSTSMEESLAAALGNLKAGIAASGAVITNDPLPAVQAEKTLMTQLLQNLIGNAIKYCAAGTVPQIHVGAGRQDDGWLFAVRDNGIGIRPEEHERIFAIFHRVENAHTAAEGTGVGLAICKKIVDYHCGRIWVQSQPGQGSTFFFTIPDTVQS